MNSLDKNTFKIVFKKYYNPLCNFAASILDDKKMAQDVVQDVFTKLWDKRENISIESNEKTYLFQSVKNRAFEVLRNKKSRLRVVDESEQLSVVKSAQNAEEEANTYMLKELLFVSIRQLPPKCQEIFVLNKLNGLTYKEIAEELGISVKTVENQIGNAYRKLRELMKGRLSEIA